MNGYACFDVTDGEEYSSARLYAAIRAGLGKSPGHAWLPKPVWAMACGVLDRLRPGADGGSYQKLFGEELYSNAAVCEALGWRPTRTLEAQVTDMLGQGR